MTRYLSSITKTVSLALLLNVLLLSANPLRADDTNTPGPDEIVFGILPIISTETLFTRFAPMAEYLSKNLGRHVRIETAPDFTTFLRRTNEEQRYDLLFTAPHFYYLAQRKANYRIINRIAAPGMRAIIIVPVNSDINTLDDLKGRRLATTDRAALATMMVQNHLKRASIDLDKDIQQVTTPNHTASLLSAYKGVTDAAALMLPPFKRSSDEIQQSMRILATTDAVPQMVFAVKQTMDSELADKAQAALLNIASDEQGNSTLLSMKWPGLVKAEADEYNSLEWAVEQLEK